MPTHLPWTINLGSAISGTIQVGNFAIGSGNLLWAANPGGVTWWMGPDEDAGYLIVKQDGSKPSFWRSTAKTDVAFVSLANSLARRFGTSTFADASAAYIWLINNGYYTTYGTLGDYLTRMIANSGTVEGTSCVTNSITALNNIQLLNPTLLIVPSGYKSGTIYAELPNTSNGDLTFTRTSTATRVNSSGSIENVASGVPQIDYSLGGCPVLLLEPQRTNWVRNSTFAGAVVGSPGTLPTNYGEPNTTLGLTRSVAATGSENGLSYIDLQYTGTASSTSPYRLTVDNASTNIPGATGQNWTMSAYMKIVSSTSLPANFQIGFVERNSAGTYLTSRYTTVTVNTTFQRQAASNSTVSATIAAVCPEIVFPVVNGNSYNFVLRIYAPQFEQGAFATSYIPTTTATVTRNASSFARSNIFTNGLISSSGGTWFVDVKNNLSILRDLSNNGFTLSGTGNNSLIIYYAYASISERLVVTKNLAGVYTDLLITSTVTSPLNLKIVLKWDGTNLDLFVNGQKISLTAGQRSFSVTNLNTLSGTGAPGPLNLAQMALWNTPLTDAQCVSLST